MIDDNLYCVVARSMVGLIYGNIRMISMELDQGNTLSMLFVLDKVVDYSDNNNVKDAIGYIEEEVYGLGVNDISFDIIFSAKPLKMIDSFPVILFMRQEDV